MFRSGVKGEGGPAGTALAHPLTTPIPHEAWLLDDRTKVLVMTVLEWTASIVGHSLTADGAKLSQRKSIFCNIT